MMDANEIAVNKPNSSELYVTLWPSTELPNSTEYAEEVTSYVEFHITIIALALYAFAFLLIIFCNALNLYIMRKPLDCFSDNTRFFLSALAVVDLLSGLICCPTEMVLAIFGNWPLSHASCDVIAIVYTMVSCQALLCLCLVSVDRFLTIVKPLRYPTIMTQKRARIVLACVLLLGALLSLTMLEARNLPSPIENTTLCALLYLDSTDPVRPLIIIIIVSFIIPASILLFVNIRLMIITIQKTRELANMSPTAVRYTTDRLKGVRTILVLTSAFFVTWLPLMCTMVAAVIFNAHIPPAWGTLVSFPALCNSWINAFIYLFMCTSYRRAVVKEVRKCFKRRHEKWVTNGSVAASAALHSEAAL
ncbi:5-hydroxytryptamine receptor 6-like [Lytechinus variegatus]|uniref:5-hydroxytryptamine receptor 6-like n=1 Tax=Lytechinus variegatus TaxID=7654 RepID=UPI001BB23231|nr:5-hydroxytryptamine receptor 6-like [Lytechinus variegatus]XP_041471061.1 5-hydroxytryptamine receptor 6-like [Lytechinus variegatus]XP_041471062.1 5-hydroxytryptamine receptor 6-like [Lytechinus variegatus]